MRELALFLVISGLALQGCTTEPEEEECGSWSNPRVLLEWDYRWSYGVQGDVAEVGWVVEASNVCTYQHVQYVVDFELDGSTASAINPSMWALSGPLRVRDIPLTEIAPNEYHASGDFGIRDSWGDGPGMVTVGVSMKFPHQGSEAADEDFFWEGASYGLLSVRYRDHQ